MITIALLLSWFDRTEKALVKIRNVINYAIANFGDFSDPLN
jgi:hypothetical protein